MNGRNFLPRISRKELLFANKSGHPFPHEAAGVIGGHPLLGYYMRV